MQQRDCNADGTREHDQPGADEGRLPRCPREATGALEFRQPGYNDKADSHEGYCQSQTKAKNRQQSETCLADGECKQHHSYRRGTRYHSARAAKGHDLKRCRPFSRIDILWKGVGVRRGVLIVGKQGMVMLSLARIIMIVRPIVFMARIMVAVIVIVIVIVFVMMILFLMVNAAVVGAILRDGPTRFLALHHNPTLSHEPCAQKKDNHAASNLKPERRLVREGLASEP